MASLPIRHYPVVHPVVSALSPELPQLGGDDAGLGPDGGLVRRCIVECASYAPELEQRGADLT